MHEGDPYRWWPILKLPNAYIHVSEFFVLVTMTGLNDASLISNGAGIFSVLETVVNHKQSLF